MHALGKQSLNSLAAQLADSAVAALIAEARLSPKPALVDRRGSGAHHDLDLSLMQASALALWPAFHDMAEAALQHGRCSLELREALGRIGREGEVAMLAATRGVNTHRGAIWVLGLLVAAAALEPENATPEALSQRVSALALLEDRFAAAHRRASHGQQVEQRYGARGAREEAQLGLPGVVLHGLPQLLRSRANGADESNARLDALLAIMATLADTCVLYRAGPEGLAAMHAGAAAVLAAGGCSTLAGRRCLRTLENDLLRLNASPGGAADLLAACLFMDQLGQPGGSL